MTPHYIITGTDTNVGKTVFASALMLALHEKYGGATYWKPMQSGIEGGTDTLAVKALTGLSENCFLPETYVFREPLSPHRAAELDEVIVESESLVVPDVLGPLVIEGAGGLMVPVTRDLLYIDLFKCWNFPVILCARTALGTINHSLLSVEALKHREIPIKGIVFIGEENSDNIRTITDFAGVPSLGCFPLMKDLNATTLLSAAQGNIKMDDL